MLQWLQDENQTGFRAGESTQEQESSAPSCAQDSRDGGTGQGHGPDTFP